MTKARALRGFPTLVICLFATTAWAGTSLGEVAFRQALRDMGTDLRLMCVAAHPDDEDGATLALYRAAYGLKTVALIATRGEGGQNEIGPELYSDLAVLRTREMMAAAHITGADLRFLDMPEFGFSKSAEETFDLWGRDETVRRLVRHIRQVQPDVIITNHDTQTGHGHHRAIGIALIEAFDAAADPHRYPEQLSEGLEPWQASRLYVRTWDEPTNAITVPIHRFDPLRGKSYADIAADALEMHRSQGMQTFIERYRSGAMEAHYLLVKEGRGSWSSDALRAPGSDASDSLLAGMADRVAPTDRASEVFASDREKLLTYVMELRANRDTSPLAHRRWKRANDAAVAAYHLRLEPNPKSDVFVGGYEGSLDFVLRDCEGIASREGNFSAVSASWFPVQLQNMPDDCRFRLGKHSATPGPNMAAASLRFILEAAAPVTLPWSETVFTPHFLAPQLTLVAHVEIDGGLLDVEAPVHIDVGHQVMADFGKDAVLARTGVQDDVKLPLVITHYGQEPTEGWVTLTASPSLKLAANRISYAFPQSGGQQVVEVHASFRENAPDGEYHVAAVVEGLPRVAHTRIRRIALSTPSQACVGVIQSYDDTLMRTLEALGVAHRAMEVEDFAPERLDTFTVVLVDIRAYLVRPDLVANNQALLDYVARGGSVIVMYQKTMEWKPEYAPYPLQISNDRVTREDATVEHLVPGHPLFTTPNVIEPRDWEGWVQERGLYFAGSWDPAYTPL